MDTNIEISRQVKRSILQNLISVMVADCKIQPSEQKYLDEVRRRLEISQEELDEVFAALGTGEFVIPEDPQKKCSLLLDMVTMMTVDGDIDPREVEVCKGMAKRLGFDSNIIGTIVESMEQEIDREKIEKCLLKHL